jgi:hypothetical protein
MLRAATIMKILMLQSGQMLWTTRQMKAEVTTRSMDWALEPLEQLEGQAVETHRATNQWSIDRKVRQGTKPESRPTDALVDDASSAVFNVASAMMRAMPEGSEIHTAASTILSTYFHDGLNAFTKQPMIEQLADVEALVEGLRGRHAAQAQILNLEPLILRLEELLPVYAHALGVTRQRVLDYSDLQALQRRDHNTLIAFAARLIVRLHDHPEEAADIHAVFAHIQRAEADTRARSSSRRPPRSADVDPNTGEPVQEPSDTPS